MREDDDIRAVFTATEAEYGPPLGIDVNDIMARGSRIRRLRKQTAVIGGSAAMTVAVILVGLLVKSRPEPVVPAGPPSVGLVTTSPQSPSAGQSPVPVPPVVAPPSLSARPSAPPSAYVGPNHFPGPPAINYPP